MYICICHGVTDKTIKNAIDEGADTLKQLSDMLNIGTQCGRCCQSTKKVLQQKLMQISEPQQRVA